MREAIQYFIDSGIIDGICIMGTDNPDKYEATKILVDFAANIGMRSIVFTGYDLMTAIRCYGYADYFVVGKYHKGEWHENKSFYKLLESESGDLLYTEISMHEYLNANTKGGPDGDQIQLRPEI